jgi:hypothetical protein
VAYRGVVDFVVAVNNFGDTRSGGLAGPMALFIIVLMSVATVLLIRGMNKHLRRLPDTFQDPETVRREAEIAHLDADLARPAAGATPPGVDEDRSDVGVPATQPEVSGPDATERRSAERGKAGQA